jgi:hypothetical protein
MICKLKVKETQIRIHTDSIWGMSRCLGRGAPLWAGLYPTFLPPPSKESENEEKEEKEDTKAK